MSQALSEKTAKKASEKTAKKASEKTAKKTSEKTAKKTSEKTAKKTSEKTAKKTSEKTSEKILSEIRKNNNVTTEQLGKLIGKTKRAIEYHIAKLKEQGLLERIGSGRAGYWKINE